MKFKPNKNDKARVIIQALYNLDKLPEKDDARVKKTARLSIEAIDDQYRKANKVLNQKSLGV